MKLKREYKEGQIIRYVSPFTKEVKFGKIFQIWKAPNNDLFEVARYFDEYYKRNDDFYVVECLESNLIDYVYSTEEGIKTCCWVQDNYIIEIIDETET